MSKLFICSIQVLILILMAVGTANAIPAFTRANNVECSTCHTIYPELNEYGEAFLKNGYVYFGKGKKKAPEKMKATSVPVSENAAPASSGEIQVKGEGNADLLSKLRAGTMAVTDAPVGATTQLAEEPVSTHENKNQATAADGKSEGILLSGIPEQLPISFTANIHGTYDRNAINEYDFSARTLKLNAGGHFKEKASFFGTYVLYTESPVSTSSNTSTVPTNLQGKNDIGELFLIWRHALDTPVNFRVGRFQPKLGLWKTNNKLSVANSYATYSYTVGTESLFKIEQPQDAIEANTIIANRLFVAAGTVNRKNQNTKEWYGHVSVKLGGADYLANEPEIDLNKDESIFDFLTLTIGGYGYVGKNGEPKTTDLLNPPQNKYYRTGVDVDLLYKVYRLKLSGVLGSDDNIDLTNSAPKAITRAAVIEGQYTILQNLIGALRYEYQDDSTNVVRRFIPIVSYAPIENLKVSAEYKYEYGISKNTSGNTDVLNKIATVGATLSF